MNTISTPESVVVFNLSRLGLSQMMERAALLYYEDEILAATYINEKEYKFDLEQVRTVVDFINQADYAVCFSTAHIGILKGACEVAGIDYPTTEIISIASVLPIKGIELNCSRVNLGELFGLRINDDYGKEEGRVYFTAEVLDALLKMDENDTIYKISKAIKSRKDKKAKAFFRSINDEAPEVSTTVMDELGDLAGKVILITGDFGMERDEIHLRLEAKGAKIVSSVTKKLNTVFVGEGAGPSKLRKIQEMKDRGMEIDLLDIQTLKKWI